MKFAAKVFLTALPLSLSLSNAFAEEAKTPNPTPSTSASDASTKKIANESIEDAPIKMEMDKPQGELIVTSNVYAALYIDHDKVGMISEKEMRFQLPIGKHTIRIAADGYNPYVRKIRIRGKKSTRIKGSLKAGGGIVELNASVKGAYVILNNGQPAKLPIRLTDLKSGKYSYVIKARGHLEESGEFEYGSQKKQNIYVYKNLESSKGMVQIDSNPKGAQVYLGDTTEEPIGETPLNQDDVPPSKHTVVIMHPNHGTVFREMDTSSGDLGSVKASLSERAASLTLLSDNKQSVYQLNNAKIGTGEQLKFGKLEKGIYNLSVTAPEHKPIHTQITIPTNGSITFQATLAPNADAKQLSSLREKESMLGNWVFWSAVGGASLAAGGAAYLTYQLMQPTPAEEGDVTIQLP